MANINDTRNLAREIQAERARLRASNVEHDDYQAIMKFVDSRQGRVSRNTLRQDMGNLRRAAEAAPGRLLDCDRPSDVDSIMAQLDREGVSAASSKNAYLRAIRQFFKFLGNEPDHPDHEWIENVKDYESDTDRRLKAEEYLTESEVTALREAATHPRERALVEFLADTGARINLVCNLRRKDVDLDGEQPNFRPNPNAKDGYKGVDIKRYPVHYSQRYIERWLNLDHPDDHPDAPLFPVKEGYDKNDRENMAMHVQTAFGAVKNLAEDVDIDKSRVNNHAFRHAAVRRMKTDPDFDFDWETVKMRTAWSDRAFESMKELYGALEDEEQLEYFMERAGRGDGEDTSDRESLFDECRRCGEEIRRDAQYCDRCGADQEGTVESGGTFRDMVRERVEAQNPEAEPEEVEHRVESAMNGLMERVIADPAVMGNPSAEDFQNATTDG